MKIFQAFSLLTIAHGSKVTRINFRKEGEGLGLRLRKTRPSPPLREGVATPDYVSRK